MRDQIKDELDTRFKELQPVEKLIVAARFMFRDFVDSGSGQMKNIKSLCTLDTQKDGLAERFFTATGPAVIRASEENLSILKRDQIGLREQINIRSCTLATIKKN